MRRPFFFESVAPQAAKSPVDVPVSIRSFFETRFLNSIDHFVWRRRTPKGYAPMGINPGQDEPERKPNQLGRESTQMFRSAVRRRL